MADWKMKRFWTKVEVTETDAGFAVTLDGRSVKTPGKSALVVPTRAMAEAMAAEWDAQEGEINPETMPVTKAANSAIDKVTPQFAEVADMLAEYAGTDLLCYRAESPRELVQQQAEAWDPLLDWCAETYDARLSPITGVMFAPQDAEALERLRAQLHKLTPFELTGLHELITLPGSLVLGLALWQDHVTAEEAWALSRVDERFQQAQWGADEEAEEMAALKYEALCAGKRFCQFLK